MVAGNIVCMEWARVFVKSVAQKQGKIRLGRRALCFGAGAAMISLAGCSVIIPEAPPQVFDLVIGGDVKNASGSSRSQILITEPKVLNVLNNDRIVAKPNASQIAFFGKVRWADRLPRLVQLYLNRAFASTGRARAVGLPGDGLVIDHQLLFDLQAFQIENQGNGSLAKVEIAVRILNDRNGKVIASKTFSNALPTSDDPVQAIRSLNEALNNVTVELISWTYRKI